LEGFVFNRFFGLAEWITFVVNVEKLRKRLLSGPLPTQLTIEEVAALYESLGFRLDRIAGSHHIFIKQGSRNHIVAVHGGKVGPSAVREIVKSLRQQG
jgi:predicted RNA binding protein YcfA (HicA-like mRNA interferase family)